MSDAYTIEGLSMTFGDQVSLRYIRMYMHVSLCDGSEPGGSTAQGEIALLQVPASLASRLWAASDKRMLNFTSPSQLIPGYRLT